MTETARWKEYSVTPWRRGVFLSLATIVFLLTDGNANRVRVIEEALAIVARTATNVRHETNLCDRLGNETRDSENIETTLVVPIERYRARLRIFCFGFSAFLEYAQTFYYELYNLNNWQNVSRLFFISLKPPPAQMA